MIQRRRPASAPAGKNLPHDTDREKGQPYAKEIEDHSGGVAKPPKEQAGEREERKAPRARPSRVK
jgi:hypothetical protein